MTRVLVALSFADEVHIAIGPVSQPGFSFGGTPAE
jgi:hypothetical protein